ncbi:MAG: transposase [Chloroflexota bacterium]|nr:MAG: transposase [Chloroflexota bacterium]GJQ53407.1 MAG: transposase [Anaerolineaceae bacterium]
MRKQYSPTFKAKVVLELLREDKTLNEAATVHGVHVNQLRRWRQQAIDEIPTIFSREQQVSQAEVKEKEAQIHDLYAEIGRLTTELTWLKKKAGH